MYDNNNYKSYQIGGFVGKNIPFDIEQWPPSVGKIVIIKSPYHKKKFIGRVEKFISNNTGAICTLLNNTDYVEKTLEVNYNVPGKGLFLLMPTHLWNYVDETKITSLMNNDSEISNINRTVQTSYDNFLNNFDHTTISSEVGAISDRARHDDLSDTIYDPTANDDLVRGIMDKNLLTSKGEPDLNYLFMDDKYTDNVDDIVFTDNEDE